MRDRRVTSLQHTHLITHALSVSSCHHNKVVFPTEYALNHSLLAVAAGDQGHSGTGKFVLELRMYPSIHFTEMCKNVAQVGYNVCMCSCMKDIGLGHFKGLGSLGQYSNRRHVSI